MTQKLVYGFALIMLALASWLVVGFLWGFFGSGWQIVRLIGFFLFALALALAFKRMSDRLRIYIGLIFLAGLLLPNSSVVAHPSLNLPEALLTLLATTLFCLPALALVSAAWLLHSGLNRYQEWRAAGKVEEAGSAAPPKLAGRAAAVLLGLSVLLLGMILYTLYWLTIWDNANDSIGYILIILPVLAALFSGVMLSITLPGRAKLAGPMVALLIPALLIAVSARSQRVDFRQLTEERAGQINRAIETFYAREGHNPQDFRQLTPGILLSIPDPVIIVGAGWCYDSGTGTTASATFTGIIGARQFLPGGPTPRKDQLRSSPALYGRNRQCAHVNQDIIVSPKS